MHLSVCVSGEKVGEGSYLGWFFQDQISSLIQSSSDKDFIPYL